MSTREVDEFISVLFTNQYISKITETWLLLACGIGILFLGAFMRYMNFSENVFSLCKCITMLFIGKILFGNQGFVLTLIFPLQYLIGIDFLQYIFN